MLNLNFFVRVNTWKLLLTIFFETFTDVKAILVHPEQRRMLTRSAIFDFREDWLTMGSKQNDAD